MRTSWASSCSTLSTGIATMVVQFGLAMMPFRGARLATSRAKFTSDTTSGTSGSLRHADELSITVTPAAANRGACTSDIVLPAENSAMSRPGRVGRRGVFDLDLLSAEGQLAALRAGGREEPHRWSPGSRARRAESRITWPT